MLIPAAVIGQWLFMGDRFDFLPVLQKNHILKGIIVIQSAFGSVAKCLNICSNFATAIWLSEYISLFLASVLN
jgi:hypothetical protein